MVHVLSLCRRWATRRLEVSELLRLKVEDGAQPFAIACLRSSVSTPALEAIVCWASEMDVEEYAFWHHSKQNH